MKNRTSILDRVESAHRHLLAKVLDQAFDPPVITPITIDGLELELRLREVLPSD